MSDLTAKFTALESQLATEHTALLGAVADLADSIALVNTNLETMIENNAANTKYLLAALGQSAACFPCPTPSIAVPPYVPTTAPVNSAQCQRSQGLIAAIEAILTGMDTLQSFNVIGSFSVINDAISQVVTGLISGGGPPLPSFPEAVNITGDYVSYAGERLFSGIGLMEQFTTIADDLRDAVYIAGSAENAKASYDAVIDSSSVSSAGKLLFKAVGYSSLFNYYLDPASEPDVSGFDGGACGGTMHGIGGCADFGAVVLSSGGHTYYYIQTPPAMGPLGLFTGGDFYGYSFQLVDGTAGRGVDLYYTTDGTDINFGQGHSVGESAQILAQHCTGIIIQTHDTDELAFPFTMRVCPPS